MPTQFQLKSVATDENKRIQTKFLDRLPYVDGMYGSNKLLANNAPSVNCNASAGMDLIELRKFLLDAVVPFYLNSLEKDRKRVLLILDSGPEKKDESLLSFLAARGFHLLPGVPTSVKPITR